MPKETDAAKYRRMFYDVWRAYNSLRADHEALMQTVIEEMPANERVRVVEKYDRTRAALLEEVLLKIEKTNPGFAAELDIDRPLFPPDSQ